MLTPEERIDALERRVQSLLESHNSSMRTLVDALYKLHRLVDRLNDTIVERIEDLQTRVERQERGFE